MGKQWKQCQILFFWAPKSLQMVTAVHWGDPEGWYGEGGERGVQDWEHVYTRGRFMLMYGKTNTILQSN